MSASGSEPKLTPIRDYGSARFCRTGPGIGYPLNLKKFEFRHSLRAIEVFIVNLKENRYPDTVLQRCLAAVTAIAHPGQWMTHSL